MGLTLGLTASAEKTFELSATRFSVQDAREEAFYDLPLTLNTRQFGWADPDWPNKQSQPGQRIVTVFDDGSYGVKIPGRIHRFYYNALGVLEIVQVNSAGESYPRKGAQYCVGPYCKRLGLSEGSLMGVVLDVSPEEGYLFYPDKRLAAIWRNDVCTRPDGRACGTRKTLR